MLYASPYTAHCGCSNWQALLFMSAMQNHRGGCLRCVPMQTTSVYLIYNRAYLQGQAWMALLTAPQGGQTGAHAYPQTWQRLLGLPRTHGSVGLWLPLHPSCSTSSSHVCKDVAGYAATLHALSREMLIMTGGMARELPLASMR